MKIDLKKFLVPKLRRASLYWPARNEALKAARIERGFYKCSMCNKAFGRKEVHADHIVPVVDVKIGFTNWDEYINSLFCSIDNYQILCSYCHSIKSNIENEMRKQNKKKVKKAKKKS